MLPHARTVCIFSCSSYSVSSLYICPGPAGNVGSSPPTLNIIQPNTDQEAKGVASISCGSWKPPPVHELLVSFCRCSVEGVALQPSVFFQLNSSCKSEGHQRTVADETSLMSLSSSTSPVHLATITLSWAVWGNERQNNLPSHPPTPRTPKGNEDWRAILLI